MQDYFLVLERSPPIAFIPFLDGITREIFLDADDRQFVLDDDGQPVYGRWVYIDEPEIVSAALDGKVFESRLPATRGSTLQF
jgi:hypothetical protein